MQKIFIALALALITLSCAEYGKNKSTIHSRLEGADGTRGLFCRQTKGVLRTRGT